MDTKSYISEVFSQMENNSDGEFLTWKLNLSLEDRQAVNVVCEELLPVGNLSCFVSKCINKNTEELSGCIEEAREMMRYYYRAWNDLYVSIQTAYEYDIKPKLQVYEEECIEAQEQLFPPTPELYDYLENKLKVDKVLQFFKDHI